MVSGRLVGVAGALGWPAGWGGRLAGVAGWLGWLAGWGGWLGWTRQPAAKPPGGLKAIKKINFPFIFSFFLDGRKNEKWKMDDFSALFFFC